TGISIIDLNVMAGHPSDRLESLTQRLKIKLCIRIVLSYAQQHADAPHALALLRARRERPSRRAAEPRDEVAAFQMIVHSVPTSGSRVAGYRIGDDQSADILRTASSFRPIRERLNLRRRASRVSASVKR